MEEFDDIDDEFFEPYDPPPTEENVMTTAEVMAELGVSRATLHNWRKRGILTAYRVGFNQQVRFKRADVLALAEQSNTLTRI